jgi:tetratricopeptide (TPR) repeat protein
MDITHYISHPDKLDRNTLYELRLTVRKYPYFDAARLLLLRNLYLLHDIEFGKEMRRAALYLKNRRVLFDIMCEYGTPSTVIAEKGTTELSVDRTMELIDAFLGTLPTEHFSLEAEGAAAIDYVSAYLSDKDDAADAPKLRGQELIDNFLAGGEERFTMQLASEPPVETREKEESTPHNDPKNNGEAPIFTETLANIYIKQGKYEKALEIIKRLCLEYPNKNRYFADQIRFLEKIIKHIKKN